jgi:hypothetical protein
VCDTADFVGVTELAEMFGVGKAAISNWRARHNDWPDPVLTLRMGPIYRLNDVDDFLKRHPNLLHPKQIAGARAGVMTKEGKRNV